MAESQPVTGGASAPASGKASRNVRSSINSAKLMELQQQMAANQRAASGRAHRRTSSDGELSLGGVPGDPLLRPHLACLRSGTASSTSTVIINRDPLSSSSGRPTHSKQVSSGGASAESMSSEPQRRKKQVNGEKPKKRIALSDDSTGNPPSNQQGGSSPQGSTLLPNQSFSHLLSSSVGGIDLGASSLSSPRLSASMRLVAQQQKGAAGSGSQAGAAMPTASIHVDRKRGLVVTPVPSSAPTSRREAAAARRNATRTSSGDATSTAVSREKQWNNGDGRSSLHAGQTDEAGRVTPLSVAREFVDGWASLRQRAAAAGLRKVVTLLFLMVVCIVQVQHLQAAQSVVNILVSQQEIASRAVFRGAVVKFAEYADRYANLSASLEANTSQAFVEQKAPEVRALKELHAAATEAVRQSCSLLECESLEELRFLAVELGSQLRQFRLKHPLGVREQSSDRSRVEFDTVDASVEDVRVAKGIQHSPAAPRQHLAKRSLTGTAGVDGAKSMMGRTPPASAELCGKDAGPDASFVHSATCLFKAHRRSIHVVAFFSLLFVFLRMR